MQYDQGIHCLYLGIEGSEQPSLLYSMIRALTVYIWVLKTQNSQRFCALWSGHSLSIFRHWRLRTASASVQYYQGIYCLYLVIEDSEQPALLYSMIRAFAVCFWALKTQNSQRFCAVWSGHSLPVSEHWRLWTASASEQYDQDIHYLYLSIEYSEQPALLYTMTRTFTIYIWLLIPALLCSMTRIFIIYIWALKALNSWHFCAEWPGNSLSISGQWILRTASASVQYDQGIHYLYLGIEDSEQSALLCSVTRAFTVYTWALKALNRQRFCAVWPGYSLSISEHWRLRTANTSVHYDQDIHYLYLSIEDQGIHCLYLGVEGSKQPALLCSMTRTLTIYIWALKALNC